MMDKLKLKWKSVNMTIHRKQPTRIEKNRKKIAHFCESTVDTSAERPTDGDENNESSLFDSLVCKRHTHTHPSCECIDSIHRIGGAHTVRESAT